MLKLVKLWRTEANELSKSIRKCEYLDQTTRVIMAAEVRTLRRCARALKKPKG